MMRTMRATLSRLALSLALCAAPVAMVTTTADVALAQPKWKLQKEAKDAYAAGNTKFDAGDFEGALADFRLADQKWPGAAPKFRIAESLDKLGRTDEAIAAYQDFIDSKPSAKYADRVITAGERIQQLEKMRKGTVTVNVTPANLQGVSITVDGSPAQGNKLELAAGSHTVEVTAPGYEPVSQQIDVQGGTTLDVPITLQPVTAPQPVTPPGDQENGTANALIIAGFVSLGVGVVGGALTTAFGVQALGAQSDFDANPSAELADDAEDNALLADVFLGVAGGFGVAGIIMLAAGFTMDSGDGGDSAVRVVPIAGPQVGGVSIDVSF